MHTIELPHEADFFARCLALSHRYPYALLLNGNGYTNYPEGPFPHRLFLGTRSVTSASDRPEGEACCGYFGYEWGQAAETASSRPVFQDFPEGMFFLPDLEIGVCSETIRLRSQNPEADLQQIRSEKPLPEPAPLPTLIFTGSTDRAGYLRRVEKIQQQIREGNLYELNLCQYFEAPASPDGLDLYRCLNRLYPMPFSCWMKFPGFEIVCLSPERFLARRGNRLFSQPIKGTAPRGKTPEEDEHNRRQLQESEKEQAENLMITDLVRNDLARVAITGTTGVSELFGIYAFPGVFQMISTVEARIGAGTSETAVFQSAFPMGSMTGAPKKEVMQQIRTLESHRRGAYSGSLGYFDSGSDFDFNVLIRSLFINHKAGTCGLAVGSAITIDSDPEEEWEECRVKARFIESAGTIIW